MSCSHGRSNPTIDCKRNGNTPWVCENDSLVEMALQCNSETESGNDNEIE